MTIAKPTQRIYKSMKRIVTVLLVVYLILAAIIYFRQRSMLYFPSHNANSSTLKPWLDRGQTIGYCRIAPHPHTIWLMMHGNAGQAADRDYVLDRMSAQDSLYVLEYPGFGSRPGNPSLESMNQAASEAYQLLRTQNPHTPIDVLGESIGSGPACSLALEKVPPSKIVLVVPLDTLANVAVERLRYFPVRLMLIDAWDNVDALSQYAGPVEIFASKNDEVIPFAHARALANQIPTARLIAITGGHNDWAANDLVKIR